MNRQTRLILDTQKNNLQAANHTEHKLTHLYHSLQLIKSVCANQYTGMSQMVMDIVSEVKKYGAKVNLEAKLRNASRTAYQQTLVRILLTHDPDT